MDRFMVEQRQGGRRFVVLKRAAPEFRTEVAERFRTYKAADAYMRERCGPPNNHYDPADQFSEGVWYIANRQTA